MKNNMILLMIGLMFTMFVCTQSKIESPERLKGIPESAFWVGGPDGGSWFVVTDIGAKDIYCFTIYFDSTAKIWYQGNFKLIGKHKSLRELKKSLSGFDGERIILVNGEYLEKIK